MLRVSGWAALALAFLAADVRAGDWTDAILAAPIRNTPGTYLPPGSTLNAPVITPVGMKHGNMLFDVTPMGKGADTIRTSHPEEHLVGNWEANAWITADFLYWATKGTAAPPLVQNGPVILPPGALPFATVPATQTLLGDELMNNGLRPGVRITGGIFLDAQKEWAIGYSAAFLGSRSERLTGGSDGTNIVNLPQSFTVLGVPIQAPLYVGYPGISRGTVTASVQSSFMTGTAELRRVAQSGTGFRLDLIAGYRYLHLGDSVATSFDVVSTTLPGPRLMGEQSARTRNDFNGGEAGFQFQGRCGKFTFDWTSTVAIGATTTEIDRSFTRSSFGGDTLAAAIGSPLPPIGVPSIQTGGLTKETDFAFVPHVGLKFGYEVIPHVRLTAGYDIIYWSRVRRAAELYNGGDSATDMWAQGMSAGFEFRY
ncbi:MAG: BBP7 family outer membrane beta-barrel protein [Gemmataceae bacterium]